jgi:hypothetical protein
MNTRVCLRVYERLAQVWMVAVLIPSLAPAQPVSVGVTGGVPVSSNSQNFGQGCFDRGPLICGPNDFLSKPYAIGPVLDLNLPRDISVEVGFLYERFQKDLAEGLTAPHGGTVNFGQKYSVSADGWLFPFLLKYTFGRRRVALFVAAGATLRHLGPFDGKGIQLNFDLQPQPTAVHIESGRDLDVAITVSAGLRWHTSVIDVTPQIRFLRWTSQYYQPVQNQAMLMLGLNFPARK